MDQLGQSRLVPIDRPETRPLEAVWLGRRDYRSVWALQKELAADRAIDAIPDLSASEREYLCELTALSLLRED